MRICNYKVVNIVVICIVLMSCVILTGCSRNDNSAGTSSNDEVCPDTLVTVDEVAFSSAIDESGRPVDSSTVFPADTQEIFGTFMVPDICCSIVVIHWFYQDDLIHEWQGVGPGTGIPLNSSITKPADGFDLGNYRVVLYINVREVTTASFTVI